MNLFEFDMKELEVNCMGIALRVILPKVGRHAFRVFSKFCVFFQKILDWSLQRYVGKCVVEKTQFFPNTLYLNSIAIIISPCPMRYLLILFLFLLIRAQLGQINGIRSITYDNYIPSRCIQPSQLSRFIYL